MADLRTGSQYGGLPGLIAPPPHNIMDFPHEQAMLAVSTDAANPEDGIQEAYDRAMKLVEGS